MRRTLGLTLILMLIISILPVGAAAAAGSPSAVVQVSRDSLPGPGTVELKLSITNNGDPIRNVTVAYPDSDKKVDLGDVGTGDTVTEENPSWEITESMLGKELRFEVTWETQDGTEKSGFTPAITIRQSDAQVDVRAEAKVDNVHAEEGDKVKFTFTFENLGNMEVTDAYLEAPPLNDGEPLGDNFSVQPGETNTKTWSPTINQEITVRPVYTYTVDGEKHTLSCDPITVRIGDAGPELVINVQSNVNRVAPGGDVEFEVSIENTGTTEIDDITVRDSQGGMLTLSQNSLQPGASASGTETVQVDASTSFVFSVSGAWQGEAVTAESTPIDITVDEALGTPTPAADLDASSIVQIDVSVVTQVQRAGIVPVEVTVKNLSAQELTNIVVSAEVTTPGGAQAAPLESSAAAAGLETVTIGTVASLAAGQNEVIEGTLDIQQTASYVFRVSAEMPDGTLVTSETSSATIELRSQSGLEMWQWIVIVAVVAAAIIAAILIVRSRRKPASTTRKAPAKRATASEKPVRPSQTYTPPAAASAAAGTETSAKHREADKAKQAAEPKMTRSASAPRKMAVKQKTAQPQQRYGDRNKF